MTPTAATLILALGGCDGGTTGDSAAADSGATGTLTDTGGTTDTTPPVPQVSATWTAVDGTQDAGVATLGLVHISDDGAGGLAVGETLAVGEAGAASVTFTLPEEPPADHLVEDPDHAGLMVATYVASAWVDADAAGDLGDGAETVLGADSDALVAYLTGTVPDGWPSGWSLADNHFEDGDAAGDPTFSDLGGGTDVVGLGLVDPSIDLGGSYQAFGGKDRGLVGLAIDSDGEPNLDDPVFDVILSGTTFDASQAQPPAAEFQFYSADAGARIGVVAGVLYNDDNGNGEYDWFLDLDPDTHTVCLGTDPVGLLFVGASTSLAAVLGLDIVGWQAGWMAVTGDPDAPDDLVRLTDAEALALAIGPTCALD